MTKLIESDGAVETLYNRLALTTTKLLNKELQRYALRRLLHDTAEQPCCIVAIPMCCCILPMLTVVWPWTRVGILLTSFLLSVLVEITNALYSTVVVDCD
jgi:hypothetical protein